jgi:hypothetical protein
VCATRGQPLPNKSQAENALIFHIVVPTCHNSYLKRRRITNKITDQSRPATTAAAGGPAFTTAQTSFYCFLTSKIGNRTY